MVAMGMVQVAVDEIIDVIAVGHGFVAAAGSVDVSGRVRSAAMPARALIRIGGVHVEHVHIVVVVVRMMEAAVFEVIGVPRVLDGDVPARGTVVVCVAVMFVAAIHGLFPLYQLRCEP